MNKTEFISVAGFAISLLFHMTQTEVCPSSCNCKSLGEMKGLHIDCSSRKLTEVPALPVNTKRLYLQNNSLTSVPPGALDSLRSLEEVKIFDNPWNCDCHILYLKLWLEDVSAPSLANIRCATPAPLKKKPLSQLTGNELGICKRLLPIKCLEFFWRDLILIAGAITTLILVAWALKFSKKLVCQINLSQYDSRG
ncbi:platelet glycoprotein IX [Aquila chrysaetos chrysaetos]|uniref:platelet glycoprotein IX n=1 Tax=Aquila chrysaetos chrysaetos TaxID=223781 RepID=UPI0005D0C12C|nr:platelet glycoprotein IX [Aquila chrysaetos chrysaetos]XP_040974553.1 platelet glycoprotein IX [Aquila chrysaetos chrysaetos]